PKGDFNCFFIFYFVVFALGGNTPASKRSDLAVGVEGNSYDTVVATARAKDFVDDADVGLDLVRGLDGYDAVGIEDDRVGLVVGRRDRGCGGGVHPGGCVRRTRWKCCKKSDGNEQHDSPA